MCLQPEAYILLLMEVAELGLLVMIVKCVIFLQ